jgi:hypothetical protein
MSASGIIKSIINAFLDALKSTDAEGNVHHVIGYKPMVAPEDTVVFDAGSRIDPADLPRTVDLRPLMSPVEDQGATSSCVANAVAGAYEYWLHRVDDQAPDISRLFVYYNARWRAGDQDEDSGAYIQLAMETLGDFGACTEATWPFEKKLLKRQPGRTAYEEASSFRVHRREKMPLELDQWKQALAQGIPIVFGCILFESFDECNQRGGVVPMPSPEEVQRESHGGHAMCAVGYSDEDEVFIVRNSWGSAWGEEGYCYMPYNYLMSPKFNGEDCWVFVPEQEMPVPEERWAKAGRPVANRGRGVDFSTNPYAADAYDAVQFDFFQSIGVVEYLAEKPDEYVEIVEIVEQESWEEIEEIDLEEIEEEEDSEDSEEEEEDSEDSEEEEEDSEEEDEEYEDEDSEEEDSEEEDSEEEDEFEEEEEEFEEEEEESEEDEEYEEEDSEEEDSEEDEEYEEEEEDSEEEEEEEEEEYEEEESEEEESEDSEEYSEDEEE